MATLRQTLARYKNKNVDLIFGRDIIANWVCEYGMKKNSGQILRILDFGCGGGTDLINIRENLVKAGKAFDLIELYGVECYGPTILEAESKGIKVSNINIEKDSYPFENSFFDVVLSNQTIEHTKEIFWIFSEVSRVLKPGGLLVTGVPNLASLHNRILFIFGIQPTSIDVLGPHIRGYTFESLKQFIESGSFCYVSEKRGGHFYPLPRPLALFFSRIFPLSSASLFVKAERTSKEGVFIEVLKKRFFETPFYMGPS